MRITSGCSAELHPPLLTRMARYRHRVFVEKPGWQLHCRDALELDQFDRDDTVYVIAQNEDGEVICTARLLPTTRPYLLGEVFPQLLNGAAPPEVPEVWELSRFASMDFSGSTGPRSTNSPRPSPPACCRRPAAVPWHVGPSAWSLYRHWGWNAC